MNITRRQVAVGLAAALAVPAAAAVVTDALGRRVSTAEPARRIVTLFPAMAETVFALGVGQRVVAVGGGVNFPPEAKAKPSVGGRLGFSPEVLIGLSPDLVVMAASTQAPSQLLRPLAAAGIPVVVLDYPRIASIFRNITLLGRLLDVEQAAERVAGVMHGEIASAQRMVAGRRRIGVFLETGSAGRASFQTVKAGHYADDAIGLAGGRNIFSGMRGPPQVTTESLLLADPDCIVVLSSDRTATPARIAAERPGWNGLKAVKAGRLKVIPRGFMLIPGPRQGEAVQILARTIHPEAFAHAA